MALEELIAPFMGLIVGFLVIFFVLGILIYVYMAVAYMALARKTNTEPAWLAWIPIANYYLISKMAGMHWWPMLLLIGGLIPFVGFITGIAFFVFMIIWNWKIMEKVGRPGWWALTVFIFPVFLILLGIAAWGNSEKK